MKIFNMTPEEYAATWGDTTAKGMLFYNFHRITPTVPWLKKFEATIQSLIETVKEGRDRPCYANEDVDELTQLLQYVIEQRTQMEQEPVNE